MKPLNKSPLSLWPKLILTIATTSLLLACSSDSDSDSSSNQLNQELSTLISAENIQGSDIAQRTLPSIDSPTAQLGMRLFFSQSLGGDQDSACVTCHHPVLGGGDDLSLSVGVGAADPVLLGEGREHDSNSPHYDAGPPVPRNAPTTFNIALWDAMLFHDGRVESISKTRGTNGSDSGIRTPDSSFDSADVNAGANLTAAQARFPITSAEEMKGFNRPNGEDNTGIRDHLAGRLGGYAGTGIADLSDNTYWLNQFRVALSQPSATADAIITYANIAFLIAEYERSQIFVATPWEDYLNGDTNALSDSAKRGALLFYRDTNNGGADCASCHSGAFFTDEKFHNIAMIQLGRGKGDGDGSEDFGRFRESQLPQDRYAFRTPTLVNVTETGPWGHAGAYTSLEAVVRHHLNAEEAIQNYDSSQLRQAGIQNLDKVATNTSTALNTPNFALHNVDLSDSEVDDLITFLAALTDPCTQDRTCLAPWILDSDEDPNGEQLIAEDQDSNTL